ncbi:hypothetical protein [Streptomyces sp. NPDC050738]
MTAELLTLAAVGVILLVGGVVESAIFTPVERRVLRTRGLLPRERHR